MEVLVGRTGRQDLSVGGTLLTLECFDKGTLLGDGQVSFVGNEMVVEDVFVVETVL